MNDQWTRRVLTDLNEIGPRSALAILRENTSTRTKQNRARLIARLARKAQAAA